MIRGIASGSVVGPRDQFETLAGIVAHGGDLRPSQSQGMSVLSYGGLDQCLAGWLGGNIGVEVYSYGQQVAAHQPDDQRVEAQPHPAQPLPRIIIR